MKKSIDNSEITTIFARAKSPLDFAYSKLKHLKNKYRHISRLYLIFAIIILALQVIVQVFSIYLFVSTIITYDHETIKNGWLVEIGPSVFVLLVTIILLPLSFFASLYQTIMRAEVYKSAMQEIQYVTMRYSESVEQYNSPEKDNIYKKEIERIIHKLKRKEAKKISIVKVIRKTFLGNKLG